MLHIHYRLMQSISQAKGAVKVSVQESSTFFTAPYHGEVSMGIGIGMSGSGVERTVIRQGSKQTTKTALRRADGSYVGTISVTQSVKKKTKRLNYNFKEISAMILQTKTSGSARQVISRARGKAALLRQRLKCGEYDDKELESAIIHAEKMERIARKRMRHLQEEEMAKRGGPCLGEEKSEEEYEIIEEIQPAEDEEAELEADRRQQEAELRKHQQELQQEMQRMMREMMEQTQRELSELSEMEELSDALGSGKVDMDPKDLDELKRKHRLDEQREIMEADMAYLKALFYKLAQEKQQNGSSGGGDSGSGSGVSLELGGVELPVETPETPVMPEGGNIDATV